MKSYIGASVGKFDFDSPSTARVGSYFGLACVTRTKSTDSFIRGPPDRPASNAQNSKLHGKSMGLRQADGKQSKEIDVLMCCTVLRISHESRKCVCFYVRIRRHQHIDKCIIRRK